MGDAGEQLADQQEEIQVEADVYFWPIVTFSLCVHAISIFRLFKWQENSLETTSGSPSQSESR